MAKKLDYFNTLLYGIGIVIGAGIYSLIGVGAAYSGYLLWVSFAIGGLIALFSAYSYAELSSMMPKEAAEYHYVKKSTSSASLAFLIEWLVFFGSFALAATLSLAFAGYFTSLFGGSAEVVALSLIIIMALFNFLGISLSASFNDLCSIVSVIGLILVALAVMISPSADFSKVLDFSSFDLLGSINSIGIIFFAFLGFEKIANISEEVSDSKKIVPKAILHSLLISSFFYCIVSFASLSVASPTELSNSSAPLGVVFSKLGYPSWILSFIALFATSNTVLLGQIAASRILNGMAKAGKVPSFFANSNSKISFVSVFFVCILTCLTVTLLDLKFAAKLGDLCAFCAYFMINVSLLILYNKSNALYKSPRIFGFPIFALFGALSSLFFIIFLGLELWMYLIPMMLLGMLFFHFSKK